MKNKVLQTLRGRRSVRSYKPEMIKEEELQAVLEAGEYAPTGLGRQSPTIICITDKETRDRLAKLNASFMGKEGIDPFYGAPIVLLVIARKDVPTAVYDGACVIDNMLNAAYSVGLGSCWIHRAKEEVETEEGKEILQKAGIQDPENYIGVGHVILGYPNGPLPEAKPRKDNYIRYIK